MRIRRIEFENFRNFRRRGEIRCSSDGRVTIIYGKNGDGKTTLHQLFQWVFYGQVHFNKTTSDRLYNLQLESEQPFGATFQVMGRVDFDHDGESYSLTRTSTYKKGLDDSDKIAEDVSLNKMDHDHNWKRLENPSETIEKLLPSGLSEYFFFDGESMIADLRVKGKDSAAKLRKALYSMFDLDVLESAISHIGRTELKTTALGKLYLSKGTITSSSEITAAKTNIENAQAKISTLKGNLNEEEEKKKRLKKLVQEVSEQIGGTKSKSEYERQRKNQQTQRDIFLRNAAAAQSNFGDIVLDMFPKLLISKAVTDAKQRIHLKIEENRLPAGINKKLIHYLLSQKTTECVCGHKLCDEERTHIRTYLDMLPPRSFTSLYNDFVRTAQGWGTGYDQERVDSCIRSVLDNTEQAAKCDMQIKELDDAEKKSPDIEDLIVARQKAEQDIATCDQEIARLGVDIKKYELYLKKQMSKFDELTRENAANRIVEKKIEILECVARHFEEKLEQASDTYSKRLEDNIQGLIDQMLTSRRKVAVSSEFSVRVTDSYNDESKSEGQFAVVSFAYIGGILKMLRSEKHLETKEYPLVLDGPFSKLDSVQRQNVIDMIPQFAPQVIIFSKDDLHGVFKDEMVGNVWTIVSNDEKNVAHIEEGHLWN